MRVRKKAAGGLLALVALVFTVPANAADRADFGEPASDSMPVVETSPDRRDQKGWNRRVQYEGGLYQRQDRRKTLLSPQEVRRILRAEGLRQIQYLDRRGRIYQVQATDQRGQRIGLVVSARSGAILTTYRLD